MIQRIQSVYLLLAALCYSFFMLLPILKLNTGTELVIEKATENIFLTVLSVALIAGSIIDVFLFKNRVFQMRIGWVLFFVNILLLSLFGYQYYLEARKAQEINLAPGAYFALVSLVFLLLAIYNINKDEKLVRSLDRLR